MKITQQFNATIHNFGTNHVASGHNYKPKTAKIGGKIVY